MAGSGNDMLHAMLEQLCAEQGIEPGDDVLDRVAGAHRYFAVNRRRLAEVDLGEIEPATVYSVGTARQDADDGGE